MIGVKTAFAHKAARQLRIRQGKKETDHAYRNCSGLDPGRDRLRDVGLLAIKSDDETGSYKNARPVNVVYTRNKIAPGVLLLGSGDERFWIRSFYSDENGKEVGPPHQLQEFLVVGQIDGGFSREFERKIALLLPFCEFRQKSL